MTHLFTSVTLRAVEHDGIISVTINGVRTETIERSALLSKAMCNQSARNLYQPIDTAVRTGADVKVLHGDLRSIFKLAD